MIKSVHIYITQYVNIRHWNNRKLVLPHT
jgi:hypothetical protein